MKMELGVGVKAVKVLAWFYRVSRFTKASLEDCLKLTKAMQKTSDTLQSVADLYDDHVSALSPLRRDLC